MQSPINFLILSCAAGRIIEATHTSYSGANSYFGGKLATSTNRSVSVVSLICSSFLTNTVI